MPYGELQLEPGINTTLTPGENARGYSASQLIRWREGKPEKLGGWVRISNDLTVGPARALHAWADLSGNPYLIAATAQRVHLYDGGVLNDITPLRVTVDITVDFSTVNGTPTATVRDVAHGASPDDWIYLSTQVSVGGLVFYGYYQIATVIDVDNYTIAHTSNATATVNNAGAVPQFFTTVALATVTVRLEDHGLTTSDTFNVEVATAVGGITIDGVYAVTSVTDADNFVITHTVVAGATANAFENAGNARILYLIPTGLESAEFISGYGVGDYGGDDYGGAQSAGATLPLRQWFWDQWGEYAIGNYTNGPFYVWIPPLSVSPRAVQISGTAPTQITCSFVSMPQQILVALGCDTGGIFDPNLVRWSAVSDYTDFVAAVTNQAGSFRIPSGSRIVGGIQGPLQAIIWTDLDVWSMRYIGPPLVFGFTKIGSGCGLMAARAVAIMGNEVYWLSTNGIFKLGAGGVETVDCTVYDVLFGLNLATAEPALNRMQVDKLCAAPHGDMSEVSFYFPSSAGDGENDTYIKLNIKERNSRGQALCDYGTLARSAWEDESALGPPIGSEPTGLLQQHEMSRDADGSPLVCFARTGFLNLQEAQQFVFIDQMEPDAKNTEGAIIDVTVYARKTQRGPYRTMGPYRFNDNTGYINPRVRGKYIAFEVGSSDLGSWWRMGLNRFRYAPDGRGG